MSTFIPLRQCKAVEESMEKAIESVLIMMEENNLDVDEIEAPLLAASQKAFKEMKKQEIQKQLKYSTTGFIDPEEQKELLNDEWAFTAEKPDWGVTEDELLQKELTVLLDKDDSDDDSWVKEENDKDELNDSTATAIEPEEEEKKVDEVDQLNESTATAILPEEEEKMNESTATAIEPEEPVKESQKEQSLHQLAAAAIDIQQEEEVVSSDSYETESSSEEESDEDEEESSEYDSSADEMSKITQNSHLPHPEDVIRVRDLPLSTTSAEKPASDNDRWIEQLENLDKMDSADQTKMLENMINEMKSAWF